MADSTSSGFITMTPAFPLVRSLSGLCRKKQIERGISWMCVSRQDQKSDGNGVLKSGKKVLERVRGRRVEERGGGRNGNAERMIRVRGAREHNLKDVDLDIPQGKLIVFTGVSGSGKSSMAFDTVFAEGQRRYVESFSAYARQMIGGGGSRPDVDAVDNLSPAISIDQSAKSNNPRSTVGTVTEALDYLRLAFGNAAIPHCPLCDKPVSPQTVDQMVKGIMDFPNDAAVYLLAPVVVGRKGRHVGVIEKMWREGITRLRVDGKFVRTEDLMSDSLKRKSKGSLAKNQSHMIEAVVDSFTMPEPDTDLEDVTDCRARVQDSARVALRLGGGTMVATVRGEGDLYTDHIYSERFGCPDHGSLEMEELSPRFFSFNSPFGACKKCNGLGFLQRFAEHTIVPDKNQPVIQAIAPLLTEKGELIYHARNFPLVGVQYGVDFHKTKWKDLDTEMQRIILYGDDDNSLWSGVIPMIENMYYSGKEYLRKRLTRFRICQVCETCNGARLMRAALSARLGLYKWEDICVGLDCATSLKRAEKLLLQLKPDQLQICRLPIQEFCNRLQLLVDLGLGYLSLDRSTGSLSGGEARRIKLATRLGSKLVGVLYVLDEPSIGLHPRDNSKLVNALKDLRDAGNTIIVVEHDEATIHQADHIIDFGPGAGELGGQVVAQGSLKVLLDQFVDRSLTAQYLSGVKEIPTPKERRSGNSGKLILRNARAFNVAGANLEIELGTLTAISGVSGSGKSSLVGAVLGPAVAEGLEQQRLETRKRRRRARSKQPEVDNEESTPSMSHWVGSDAAYDCLEGLENIERVVNINQAPIGRTPRSNPATYSGAFDHVRAAFATTEQARELGLTPGDFSFNKKGGRCEACEGQGSITLSMLFLPDVIVKCTACGGKRFSEVVLSASYDGKTIADVLSMTIDEACVAFSGLRGAHVRLKALQEVGLGYMRLGQPAPTLSGGEAQRVKLASELASTKSEVKGGTLYLIDEPTTGLSFYDVHLLTDALQLLVDRGNTVVVIEHNMDVIRVADRVVEMGPEGGKGGGKIVAYGTPEEVAEAQGSHTAPFLKETLRKHGRGRLAAAEKRNGEINARERIMVESGVQ